MEKKSTEAPTIKLSNIGLEYRKICRRCGCLIPPEDVVCPQEKCPGHQGPVSIAVVQVAVPGSVTWVDEEFICHKKPMITTGFGDYNGWECEVCGHIVLDVASGKM